MSSETKTIAQAAINQLIRDFQDNPDLFLTEEDMRCHLVSRLLKNRHLSTLKNTANGTKSIPIHTEVRWYGRNGKLKYRSDIVILDVKALKTKEPFKLPSKGYGFDKFSVVIELKLRRFNNRSNPKLVKMLDYDFNRIKHLISEVDGLDVDYHILCFDKKSDISSLLTKYQNNRKIKFKYVFKKS